MDVVSVLDEKEISYNFTSLKNSVKGLDKSNGGMDDNEIKEFLRALFYYEYTQLDKIDEQIRESIQSIPWDDPSKQDELKALEVELDKSSTAMDTLSKKGYDVVREDITRKELEKYMEQYLESPRAKSISKFSTFSLMSNKPVSTPIGVAPLLQNLSPVHSLGL